jgi:hypothetical protein
MSVVVVGGVPLAHAVLEHLKVLVVLGRHARDSRDLRHHAAHLRVSLTRGVAPGVDTRATGGDDATCMLR